MDAELKARWLKALRSGKYQQGRRMLLAGDGAMCCLGVLATICGASRSDILERRLSHLPADLRLSGLPSDADQKQLASMNDIGASFMAIADYIAEHIPTSDDRPAGKPG